MIGDSIEIPHSLCHPDASPRRCSYCGERLELDKDGRPKGKCPGRLTYTGGKKRDKATLDDYDAKRFYVAHRQAEERFLKLIDYFRKEFEIDPQCGKNPDGSEREGGDTLQDALIRCLDEHFEMEYERIADHNYRLGESVGLAEAAAKLMTMAREMFSQGRDERAKELRRISNQFKEDADTRHPRKEAKA
jgi:hypothetical protein